MCTYKPQPTRGPLFIAQMVPRKSKKFHGSNSKPWKITRKGLGISPRPSLRSGYFPTTYVLCVIRKLLAHRWDWIFFVPSTKLSPSEKKALRRNYLDVSGNSGYPQIIHFNRVFHYFHHPFWGTVALFSKNHPFSIIVPKRPYGLIIRTPPNLASEDWGFWMSSRNFVPGGGFPGNHHLKSSLPKSSMWSWILKDFQVESSHHRQNISYWLRIHRCPLRFAIPIQMASHVWFKTFRRKNHHFSHDFLFHNHGSVENKTLKQDEISLQKGCYFLLHFPDDWQKKPTSSKAQIHITPLDPPIHACGITIWKIG